MTKKLMIFVLLIPLVLSGLAVAQDVTEWTCDGGPYDVLSAAQAAYDEGKRDEETYWLAAHAEALCTHDLDRFRQAQRIRTRLDSRRPAREPGRVDLGDYTLYLSCRGEGSPTVIFENGLDASFISSWRLVFPAVSTVTTACQYDRLGQGVSDPVLPDTIRSTQDQVDDLIQLLEIAEIEPPYVLVGHSWAGYNLLLMVDQYPDFVEGIAMVDTTHPDLFQRFEENGMDPPIIIEPEDSQERLDEATCLAQVSDVKDLGDRPLAVISAGRISERNPYGVDTPIWVELLEEYATYSTNSRYIVAEHSGHMIMTTEPAVVIDAILWVLEEVWAAEEAE